MAPQLRAYDDPARFQAETFPFLLMQEAMNNVIVGLIHTLRHEPTRFPKYYLRAVFDEGKAIGCAVMTPPYGIVLSEMPPAAVDLIFDDSLNFSDVPPSVVGPRGPAERFKDLRLARGGGGLSSRIEQGLYQLESVVAPPSVPGRMRLAGHEDLALLEQWNREFLIECHLAREVSQARALAEASVRNGSRYFWEREGRVVSMAGVSGQTPSGVRIGYVYTPPAQRGKGYASILVAELSEKNLRDGKRFCFLFTDVSNPTSNRLYRKLGYHGVRECAYYVF